MYLIDCLYISLIADILFDRTAGYESNHAQNHRTSPHCMADTTLWYFQIACWDVNDA